ncbi:MAG: Flp family type IVb pilin [Gammaproteobacteria bacterium]|nr:Flp family type IVb pilin [Gammaproteobacteria bacterium]
MLKKFVAFLSREDGASAVEYGLIVGLVAIAAVVVLLAMGGDLTTLFTQVQEALQSATGGGS